MKKVETKISDNQHNKFRLWLKRNGITAADFLRGKINEVTNPKKKK